MARHYFVGGGIASLAGAVFLVRDAGVPGEDITIFEESDRLGGSLDGAGSSEAGYLVRGGRMFEPHFACTFDLLRSIPSADDPGLSALDDIFRFNEAVPGSSRCRLVRGGKKAPMDRFNIPARDLWNLLKLVGRSEASLAGKRIDECFSPDFFACEFWLMWSTTFAFESWHSAIELRRYFKRFIHLFPGFKRLEGVLRTRHNQYDSLIAPIAAWLEEKGVRWQAKTRVTDAILQREGGRRRITELRITQDGEPGSIVIGAEDRVYLTLGSITDGATLGDNRRAPPQSDATPPAAALWRRLAARDEVFGRPDIFLGDRTRTSWTSFTVTLQNPAFFEFMETFTGNRAGTGGLVTIAGSGWLMSVVLFHQPHFRHQQAHEYVFWGYGLLGGRKGDFVEKPLPDCSGDEILEELAGQFGLGAAAEEMFAGASVIPCTMPFITSQFMPRAPGDRPTVLPHGAENFAVLGQFCEMSRDTVFTVEYSVRSAKEAVWRLTGKGAPPPPVRRTDLGPMVVLRAGLELMKG